MPKFSTSAPLRTWVTRPLRPVSSATRSSPPHISINCRGREGGGVLGVGVIEEHGAAECGAAECGAACGAQRGFAWGTNGY